MHAVLEAVEKRVSRELRGLGGDIAQRHPGDKHYLWSMQQVVEHLQLSYHCTAEKLRSRLRKGSLPRNRKRSPLQWILQLMVLGFGHFPRGVPALEKTAPANGPQFMMDGEGWALKLKTEMKSVDDLLDRCRQRFGTERIAVHPLLGPLRVDQWRRYHAVHTLHHVQKLRRIRKQVAPQLVEVRVSNAGLTKEVQIPAQRSIT